MKARIAVLEVTEMELPATVHSLDDYENRPTIEIRMLENPVFAFKVDKNVVSVVSLLIRDWSLPLS